MPTLLIAVRAEPLAHALCAKLSSQYEIHTCSTPNKTAELLAQLRPDVLIADVRMLYTQDPPHIRIPDPHPSAILVLTNIATESILEAIYAAGAQAVMTIPCRAAAVIRTLEQITKETPHLEFSL